QLTLVAEQAATDLDAAPQLGLPTLPQLSGAAEPLADMLPWLAHNALVHYLAPRGLEQYSGGGWGVRDVCQGPLEMLLALGHAAPVRDLLTRVFSAQNADGDWPQWFMFFQRDAQIRAGDSHGDIVFWPLLGLARYLLASGDAALLEETLPFHDDAPAPLREHLRRALALIERRMIPGRGLVAYGHGDWNDALQPADPALRESLCSAWTVTLHAQTLATLAEAYEHLGLDAGSLREEHAAVQAAFQRELVRDGIVAGYAHFPDDAPPALWIHPSAPTAGLHYSLLPMMHAVLENLLTPAQAAAQADAIDRHLKGPDGARLFDAPLPYQGGLMTRFQRAESSSFFGREIGIMYMHAHLRWAQMLAHLGRAGAFWQALNQAHPILVRERVPSATPRQANCYYSSSDAAYADRYEAHADYGRVAAGTVELDGGWRVYSSGPGIMLGLVIGSLLGLRLEQDALLIDPVMPQALAGLRARVALADFVLELHYQPGPQGVGVTELRGDAGRSLPFTRRPHPYRAGPAAIMRPAPGTVLQLEVRSG
ncbi:GH36-type glycosyl hydrolase domain-containing protein, partial [Pelomonas sp. KK5]|uniref:GH36-type glycosyl hydrolase domain-containing protein n=1 Tax=Pelomonas sp. KK5 TaxID=1855730 RepID=UPI00351442E4